LKPGIDLTRAAGETSTTVERIIQTAPDVEPGRRRNGFRPVLSPLQDRISGRFHGVLAMLAAAVALLMLLVSANISNLLLARASARRKGSAPRPRPCGGRFSGRPWSSPRPDWQSAFPLRGSRRRRCRDYCSGLPHPTP
jgi:hypothetical protein